MNKLFFIVLVMIGSVFALIPIPLQEMTVNGMVYADLNANGIHDSGELGLQYIQIKVVDENDTDIAHTSTTETGYYSGTVSCRSGTKLWVTAVAPDGMTHTRDESYEFSCLDGSSIYSLFGLSGTVCAWNYDCRAEEYCSSGLCRPLTCGEGYYAHNHECIPVPECTTPSDCGTEETCEAFECVPLYCAGLEGYEIINHKCYPVEEEEPEEVPECTEDDDCDYDEICSDGSCVMIICPENFKPADHLCMYVPPEVPEEVPEEKPPEEVPEKPKENVTIEIPEEQPPAEEEQPEENVTVDIPKEEAPAEPEDSTGYILIAIVLIVAVAAGVIGYLLMTRKK